MTHSKILLTFGVIGKECLNEPFAHETSEALSRLIMLRLPSLCCTIVSHLTQVWVVDYNAFQRKFRRKVHSVDSTPLEPPT